MTTLLTRAALAAAHRAPVISSLLATARDLRRVDPGESLLIAGVSIPVDGIDVEQGRPFAASEREPEQVTQVIIHESVTTSAANADSVLRRRKIDGRRNVLGVQAMIGEDAIVTQHNDLATDRLVHAARHNGRSIGLEIVNPYYPRHLRAGMPWRRVIDARWAHERRYVVPTRAQLESLVAVLRGIFAASARKLIAVPKAWPGVERGRISMSRHAGLIEAPGVQAHAYSAHADGAFPVLYAYLRLERGLSATDAYTTAIDLATDAGGRIDLAGI